MSPASSGALEIERYIGACLISSQQSRHKGKHHNLVQQSQSQSQQKQHQQHQQQHNYHQHNQFNAGNHGNHSYVQDLYRGFHQQHPQAPQQHVVSAGAHHQPQQQVGGGERWAGGLPLIVYAKQEQHRQFVMAGNWPRHMVDVSSCDNRIPQSVHQQQHQSPDCNNPLSRLAVHTQGAPLILSNNRYRNKNKGKFNTPSGVNIGSVNKQLSGNPLISGNQITSTKCRENNVDTVSVASDESSGSANSENCLPRIIKPRKRRKKDRKPPPHLSTASASRSLSQDDSFSTDSGATASPDIINVTTPILSLHLPPSFPQYNYTRERISSEPATSTGNNDISETPTLHHSFEDIEDHLDVTDINGNVESSCQCRYCDPSGQIWDIDRNCYSPFLTSPVENMFRFSISPYKTSQSSSIYQCPPSDNDVFVDPDHSHHNHGLENGISSFSLEDKNRSNGDMDKGANCSEGAHFNHQQHRSETDLEVSTEIVTSLNGHRDLEIKFFTSSSSMRKDCVEVDGDSAESEIDNQAGYLLFEANCRKKLSSQLCD